MESRHIIIPHPHTALIVSVVVPLCALLVFGYLTLPTAKAVGFSLQAGNSSEVSLPTSTGTT